MAFLLTGSRYIPTALRTLPFQMLNDWRETISTLQHALLTVRNVRWNKPIPYLVVLISLMAGYGFFVDEDGILVGCNVYCDGCSTQTNPALMEAELLRHLYHDGTGRVDYASRGAGGRIVQELTSDTYGDVLYPTTWFSSWFVGSSDRSPNYRPSEYAINPDTHLGSCWPMRGRNGTLGIALARPVVIASFTIDHVPSSMAINPRSAPRSGELWGALQTGGKLESSVLTGSGLRISNFSSILPRSASQSQIRSSPSHDFVLLGTFTRKLDHGLPFQTFDVPRDIIAALGDTVFNTVVFVIQDNWGEDEYTCLYRVRVHEL